MNSLSSDIHRLIFSFLDVKHLMRCMCVCHMWHDTPILDLLQILFTKYERACTPLELQMLDDAFLLKLLFKDKIRMLNTDQHKPNTLSHKWLKLKSELLTLKSTQQQQQQRRSVKMQTFIRVRPNNNNAYPLISSFQLHSLTMKGTNQTTRTFCNFQRVFNGRQTQLSIYRQAVSNTCVDIINGKDATVLCYGQTSTGKTYSVFGPPLLDWIEISKLEEYKNKSILEVNSYLTATTSSDNKNQQLEQNNKTLDEMGFAPRILIDLLWLCRMEKTETKHHIKVSVVEIYKEEIFDLLDDDDDDNNDNIMVKKKKKTKKTVKLNPIREKQHFELDETSVNQFEITNLSDVIKLMEIIEIKRNTRSTIANTRSSRSHVIVTITLFQRPNVKNSNLSLHNRLHIVDLAGSEKSNVTNYSTETKSINLSLTSLIRCINALLDKTKHIPFRDSTITKFLSHALTGQSGLTLLVTCSANICDMQETASSLRLAEKVAQMRINDNDNDNQNNNQNNQNQNNDNQKNNDNLYMNKYIQQVQIHEKLSLIRGKQTTGSNISLYKMLLGQRDELGGSLHGLFQLFNTYNNIYKYDEEVKWLNVSVRLYIMIKICEELNEYYKNKKDRQETGNDDDDDGFGFLHPKNINLCISKPKLNNQQNNNNNNINEINLITTCYNHNTRVYLSIDNDMEEAIFLSPERIVSPLESKTNHHKKNKQQKVYKSTDVWCLGLLLIVMWQRGKGIRNSISKSEIKKILVDQNNKNATNWTIKGKEIIHVSSAVPVPIRRLIIRCLEIDTKKRISLNKVLLELKRLLEKV